MSYFCANLTPCLGTPKTWVHKQNTSLVPAHQTIIKTCTLLIREKFGRILPHSSIYKHSHRGLCLFSFSLSYHSLIHHKTNTMSTVAHRPHAGTYMGTGERGEVQHDFIHKINFPSFQQTNGKA